MRLILLLFLCTSLLAEEVELEPEELSVPEEISAIATLEMTIENALRDDKYDKTIQIDIQESIDRMEKLIKDAEEAKETDIESRRKNDLLAMKGDRKNPGKPPRVAGTDTDKKHYDDSSGDWAHLPRSQRNEIVQVWAADIPLLWKRRLEAYFLSVNAEDTKDPPKKAKP